MGTQGRLYVLPFHCWCSAYCFQLTFKFDYLFHFPLLEVKCKSFSTFSFFSSLMFFIHLLYRTVRAISSDRGKVVSGSDDHSILVWDKQTTQLLEELKGHNAQVSVNLFMLDVLNPFVRYPIENVSLIWQFCLGFRT